jgi:hypothetical protein
MGDLGSDNYFEYQFARREIAAEQPLFVPPKKVTVQRLPWWKRILGRLNLRKEKPDPWKWTEHR